MKKVLKRVVAFILTLAMCVCTTGTAASAEAAVTTGGVQSSWDGMTTENKYVGENFSVTFSLAGYWNGGYNANIRVENTGSSVIENWYLSFALNNKLTTIWNAEVVSNENGQYVVKNANWNADIPVGGCAEFGISVNETFAGFPEEYKLLGESTQVQEEAYSVEYILDNDWGTGFTARMLLTNHTENALEDWTLEFDFDREITSIWNGVIEAHEGNHYVIKNAGHNANVVSGNAISFGFNGDGGAKEDEPHNCFLFTLCNVGDNDAENDKEIVDTFWGITWDEMQDTDSDGLPDVYEKENMLDPENPDTDGDGLLDGFEVLMASSNPLDKYTWANGIIDAELDPDGDGLTLLEEQLIETAPLMADTDGDGLIDGDEVKIFKTNPKLFDTDNDGLGDGVELEIGLDPLNPQTFGYPDKDYRYTIKIDSLSDKLTKINNNNMDYLMDIEIEGCGDVFSELLVRNSAYSYSLESNFSLGVMPEIMYGGEGTIESVKVSFQIDDKHIYEKCSSEDLRGVKRYSIFYFDEENSIVVPLSTDVDEDNNVITAVSSKVGTFILVDMERWFTSLGYEIVDENSENQEDDTSVQLFSLKEMRFGYSEESDDSNEIKIVSGNESEEILSASGCLEAEEDVIVGDDITRDRAMFSLSRSGADDSVSSIPETIEPGVTPVELVFCINNNIYDISDTEFESIKQNILIIGKTVFQNCRLPRIYILDQNGNLVESKYGSDYTTYEAGLEYMIESVKNTPPQVQNFGKQLGTLINDIQFREDSYRAIVFFGDTYLPSNSEELSQAVADKGVRCIINCPYTQSGSWYDRLSKKTNGLLLYSYLDFSDEIIAFMFGDAVIKEPTTYNMVSSMGLKKIVLKGQLNSHSNVDTDGDSLSDWSEIRTDRITVNPGGGAILPTYYEYLKKYHYLEFLKWKIQYKNLYDRNGKSIDDILNEVFVLPVLSDPTMKDSDGDGILDNIERTQKVIDERYECMKPFHTDTIETIYPELSDTRINNPSYPSYITVDGNDVVVHLKVVFKGDTDVKANSVLKTSVTDTNVVNEISNITSRIGDDPTLKELAIDGIKSRWSGTYIGNKYDFCEGLQVNFSVEIIEVQAERGKNEIHIILNSEECGVSHMSGVDWNTSCNRIINLYTSYCDKWLHFGGDGLSCSDYTSSLYHIAQFAGTAAHEMGHGMGLKDLYPSASVNHGYTIKANSEIVYSSSYFALPAAGVIMKSNGRATENDVEMLLLAFSENKWQYYVPHGKKQKMSKAIKSPVTFENEDKPGVVYRWDEESHSFKEV